MRCTVRVEEPCCLMRLISTLQVPKLCPIVLLTKSVSPIEIRMGHSWNDTDRVRQDYRYGILSLYHYVHHKSYTEWPGNEPGSLRLDTSD